MWRKPEAGRHGITDGFVIPPGLRKVKEDIMKGILAAAFALIFGLVFLGSFPVFAGDVVYKDILP